MNLVIIGTDNSPQVKKNGLKNSKHLTKINGEYLVERIIRIGRINGVEKVFCMINSNELELKQLLSTNDFGIPVKVFVQDTENSMHSLFVMAPFLMKKPFYLLNMDMVFIEDEFSEFVSYSQLQEDADGVLAVSKYLNDKETLCVAMNDEDTILKFSDSTDGYSWAAGGIYYFLPSIFNEMEYILHAGIFNLSKTLQLLIVKRYVLKGFSFSRIIRVENATDVTAAQDLLGVIK